MTKERAGSTAKLEALLKEQLWQILEDVPSLSEEDMNVYLKCCTLGVDSLADATLEGLMAMAENAVCKNKIRLASDRLRQALGEFEAGGDVVVVENVWNSLDDDMPLGDLAGNIKEAIGTMFSQLAAFIEENADSLPIQDDQLEHKQRMLSLMKSLSEACWLGGAAAARNPHTPCRGFSSRWKVIL